MNLPSVNGYQESSIYLGRVRNLRRNYVANSAAEDKSWIIGVQKKERLIRLEIQKQYRYSASAVHGSENSFFGAKSSASESGCCYLPLRSNCQKKMRKRTMLI